MATKEDYLRLFGSTTDAIEFETVVLSVGDKFLPGMAREVKAGSEPSPEYWGWLISQINGQ